MTRPALPEAFIRNSWANRSRKCPKCGTEFVSKRLRRGCPKCRHVFCPYEEYGSPPDLDLDALWEEAAIITDETSAWIMSMLGERAYELPKRPENFDKPKLRDLLRHEREIWDFNHQLMQEALDAGGELWQWSTSKESWEAMMGRCGLAVVKDGRVIAVKITAMN